MDNSIQFIKNYLMRNKKKVFQPVTRAKIDTGFACNINCFFCYYKKNLKDNFMDIKKIHLQLSKAKYFNFKKIDLSGGESSYHPSFFDILKKSNEFGFYTTTLSNGIKFSNIDFIQKSKDYGLNEILFSVHGLKEQHNKSTGGDHFNKILEALENASKINLKIRINTTVHFNNIHEISQLYAFLRSNYNYGTHNFIFINKFYDNNLNMQYNKEKIKNLVNEIYSINKDIKVRYLPYCMVPDNIKSLNYNYLNQFIDKDDWYLLLIYYKDYLLYKNKQDLFSIKKIINYIIKSRSEYNYYNKDCSQCLYKNICDGYKK